MLGKRLLKTINDKELGLIFLNLMSPLFIWNIYLAKVYIRVIEDEHELVDMWVLQFERFMENPTINKRRSKVCNTCID